jgi:tryptophan synthase alpha chain
MNASIKPSTRYNKRLAQWKQEGRKAFVPFTLLGWPTPEACFHQIQLMIESGASALELGLAFSDPVADGPVIQEAVTEVLANGFTVDDGFEIIKRARALDADIPIGLLVYHNMILARGVDTFFRDISTIGVDSVLVADLPPEAAEPIYQAACQHNVSLIFIVSPVTSPDRLEKILGFASGFLYVVSRLGITGTEERYDQALQSLIETIHAKTDLHALVGFGISTPENAQKMLDVGADGVITGSKIIQIVREHHKSERGFQEPLRAFLKSMVDKTR